MYESWLLSQSRSHVFPQRRNSGSSMRRRCFWTSQRSRPTPSRPSNRVWEGSTHSSNTTKSVSIQSRRYPADASILAKQRCRGQARGSHPMVGQVEGQCGDCWRRRESPGGRETRAVDSVCIMSLLSCEELKLIVCRSLEDIEKRSEALLGKGKAARLLDKTQDSSTVVKLIEELRQAILMYQVCTIGSLISGRVNAFEIAIAAAIDRQPGRAVDCRFSPIVFAPGTDE